MRGRALILLLLAVVIGIPFAMRPPAAREAADRDARTVVIVTPHVAQIRLEFDRAFRRWHERVYHEPVRVVWLVPGGTSEIVKQLVSKYNAAIRSGEIAPDGSCTPGVIPIDLMMGGGSYDHGRLKSARDVFAEITTGGPDGPQKKTVNISMSVPAGFTREELEAWYGPNSVGVSLLYDPGDPAKSDPGQYWLGTALSCFGIVYNKDVLAGLGVPEPESFEDLARPELIGSVALSDPRQSGSITTSLDAILSHYGWEKGWRLIREMCANTRYFTNQSTKPPIDVAHGEAAMGLAIDFYGRNQAQAVVPPGHDVRESRVGYVDPRGATSIDADPVSILRGGPNPEIARRFARFCLSEEGQALWQFAPTRTPEGAANPPGPDGRPMGPDEYALRRMPASRFLYEKYTSYMIDKVNPFDLATRSKPAGWRDAIGVMMGAFACDLAEEERAAWSALLRARRSDSVPPERLAEMESLFYAFPTTRLADGRDLGFTPDNFKSIKGAWDDAKKAGTMPEIQIAYTGFFRKNYARIVDLERSKP